MRKIGIKDTVELIGIAAIVASLVFVGIQLRQEQEIAIADTFGSVSEMTVEISIFIGQNMGIWKKGMNGGELSPDEFGVFQGLYSAVESHNQRMFVRWRRIGPGDPNEIASDFAYALYVFPGIRELYVADGNYEKAKNDARGFQTELGIWRSTVDKYVAKFDREQPAIPDDIDLLFWDF
jgi:hypothetical protein